MVSSEILHVSTAVNLWYSPESRLELSTSWSTNGHSYVVSCTGAVVYPIRYPTAMALRSFATDYRERLFRLVCFSFKLIDNVAALGIGHLAICAGLHVGIQLQNYHPNMKTRVNKIPSITISHSTINQSGRI